MTRSEVTEDLDLIGTAQVADLLEIDRSIVIRRVKAGGITAAMKLPGKTGSHLYHRAEIEALLEPPTEAAADLIPAAVIGGDSSASPNAPSHASGDAA